MKTKCCTQDCRQGRDCPLRKPKTCSESNQPSLAVGMSTTLYVAHQTCGCFQGFATTGTPQQNKDAGRYVGLWIREGHTVDRVVLKSGEELTAAICQEHAQP